MRSVIGHDYIADVGGESSQCNVIAKLHVPYELDKVGFPGTKCPRVFGRHKPSSRPSNNAE